MVKWNQRHQISTYCNFQVFILSLVLLLIINLTNDLRLHQFLLTKTTVANKSLKYDKMELISKITNEKMD